MNNSFNSSYLIFSNGLKTKESGLDFVLPPNYKLVTLHMFGKTINTNLVASIFDQIEGKTPMINNFFNINCPIARGTVKKMIEDSMIKDYLKKKFNEDPKNITNYFNLYNVKHDVNQVVETIEQFNKIIEAQNLEDIKKFIGLEIRNYRSGDTCPNLLVNFKLDPKLSSIPLGIYNVSGLKDFDYEKTCKEIDLKKKSMESLVNFEQKEYIFDNSNNSNSFFNTIKNQVPGGLLILLVCDSFDKPQTKLIKQKLVSKKYYIDY